MLIKTIVLQHWNFPQESLTGSRNRVEAEASWKRNLSISRGSDNLSNHQAGEDGADSEDGRGVSGLGLLSDA